MGSRTTVKVAPAVFGVGAAVGTVTAGPAPRPREFQNAAGFEATYTRGPQIEATEPFFQSLGTNDRSCGTCHDPAAGFSISPALAQARFDATGGMDPLFRAHDGANTPLADVSSIEASRSAYSMLLGRGVFRIGLPVPEGGEYAVTSIDDPHGYATPAEFSLYRRPLPATNLRYNATVMWDGRETQPGQSLLDSLRSQATNAHAGHAQGQPLTPSVLRRIVDFEIGLHTAQLRNTVAGRLDLAGGRGGPIYLTRQV